MRMKLSAAFLAICLCVSQEVNALSFISRGYPGESIEAKIAFAELAEPLWYVVGSIPLTLSEIIAEHCGDQPEKFLDYLYKRAVKLNDERFPNRPIESGSVVAVPFCHKIERHPMVYVTEGDSLYLLAKRNMGVAGNKTLESIAELNLSWDAPSPSQIDSFAKTLSIGRSLTLPFRTTERVFHPISGSVGPREIIARFPPIGFELAAALETVNPTVQPRPHQLEPVGFVPSNSPVTTSGCPGSGNLSASPPFDLAQVRDRLAAEKAFLDSIREPPQFAVVGIIDTGLKTVGNGFFQERLFVANKAESGGLAKEGKDDDGNDHVDDIWGSNFTDKNGVIEAFGGDNSQHGTRMAALALGGADFVHSLSPVEEPIVKLKIVNFSDKLTAGLVNPTVFPEAVSYLVVGVKPEANIINVSLSSTTNIIPIRNAINNHPEVLFVAAAANDLSGGKDLSVVPAWPARLSGNHDFAANLITVASHTSRGRHAEHSNWGANVDIHALGCAINSVHIDGTMVAETGSSVAAAIVSFTAGVVRALGGSRMPPEKIKKRLIAGSDMDSGLGNSSWTNARLNVVKAISLTHDVIETKNTPSYLFSRLKDTETLRTFCKEQEKRRQLNNIAKVRPNIEADDGTNSIIEYWIDVPMRIAKITCTQTHSNESIGIHINNNREEAGPRLADVVDIVIASLK